LGGANFPLQSFRGRHHKGRAAVKLGLFGLETVIRERTACPPVCGCTRARGGSSLQTSGALAKRHRAASNPAVVQYTARSRFTLDLFAAVKTMSASDIWIRAGQKVFPAVSFAFSEEFIR